MSIPDRREAVAELSADGESNRSIAEFVGVDESTVRADKSAGNPAADDSAIAETLENSSDGAGNPADPLDAVATLAADSQVRTTIKSIETRKANEERRKEELHRAVTVELPKGLHHGDFYELSVAIPSDSVELIFTDPPLNYVSPPRSIAVVGRRSPLLVTTSAAFKERWTSLKSKSTRRSRSTSSSDPISASSLHFAINVLSCGLIDMLISSSGGGVNSCRVIAA